MCWCHWELEFLGREKGDADIRLMRLSPKPSVLWKLKGITMNLWSICISWLCLQKSRSRNNENLVAMNHPSVQIVVSKYQFLQKGPCTLCRKGWNLGRKMYKLGTFFGTRKQVVNRDWGYVERSRPPHCQIYGKWNFNKNNNCSGSKWKTYVKMQKFIVTLKTQNLIDRILMMLRN